MAVLTAGGVDSVLDRRMVLLHAALRSDDGRGPDDGEIPVPAIGIEQVDVDLCTEDVAHCTRELRSRQPAQHSGSRCVRRRIRKQRAHAARPAAARSCAAGRTGTSSRATGATRATGIGRRRSRAARSARRRAGGRSRVAIFALKRGVIFADVSRARHERRRASYRDFSRATPRGPRRLLHLVLREHNPA
jgi:hypothetical protein